MNGMSNAFDTKPGTSFDVVTSVEGCWNYVDLGI